MSPKDLKTGMSVDVDCPQILVLEDDRALSGLLVAGLQDNGYKVTLHTNATSALTYVERYHVDLIITDLFIRMDGALVPDGGLTLISRLKQVLRHTAPIIAISGAFSDDLNKEHAVSSAITLGADATLAKPFSHEDLQELVVSLLD